MQDNSKYDAILKAYITHSGVILHDDELKEYFEEKTVEELKSFIIYGVKHLPYKVPNLRFKRRGMTKIISTAYKILSQKVLKKEGTNFTNEEWSNILGMLEETERTGPIITQKSYYIDDDGR